MDKPSELFLFGAGAVIDWGAPPTPKITETIRKSGFKIKGTDKTITEFIYQRFIECGYQDYEINFETIINVIEELVIYHSGFNSETQTPSLLKAFLEERDLSEIYNFSTIGGIGELNHGFQLQIPKGVDYPYSGYAFWKEKPNQFFLQHLINQLLSKISNIVSEYSWDTDGHSVIDKDSEVSLNFRQWMKALAKSNILRLYTLNYDCLFKCLLEKEEIECFDGFLNHSSNDYHYRPDILRILSDTSSNIHYSLHGSVYWDVIGLDKDSLPNPEIVKTLVIGSHVNNTPASIQAEKGKTTQVTNIITGYQKTQKSSLTPYKQLQSAFDKDCYLSKMITIVGYSFNDEHINESLKTALRYNKDVSVEIVDPAFIQNEMDYIFALNIFPFIGSNNMNPKKVAENEFHYYEGKLKVFTLTFAQYLKLKCHENNKHEPIK